MPGPASDWIRIESDLYWYVLVLAFVAIALWETFRQNHRLTLPNGRRWLVHTVLAAIGTAAALLIFPFTGVVLAASISPERWGLLNHPSLPWALRCLLGFVLLDLVRFGQHYCYHAIPILWRFHRVHHADPDFDLTTGFRFHPGEALLTNATYLLTIVIVAPPPAAVLAVELASVAQNLFSHANVKIPNRLESLLRRVIITPGLHRIHHSIDVTEHGMNLGILFPWWDRVAGTFLADPVGTEKKRETGLPELRGSSSYHLFTLLALPFQRTRT